jgi:hypothetical protein
VDRRCPVTTHRSSSCLPARLLAGLALLCLSGLPRSAAAQSPKEVAAARQAFREGEEAENKGDLVAAITKFQQALAIKETAQLHLRIGAAQEKLGRLVDALASYERGLEKAASHPAVAKVAREQIDALRPRVPLVVVIVERRPPGLALTLDGAPLAPAAIGTEIPVDPGTHRLHAQAPGWLPRDQTFEAAERGRPRVKVDISPREAPPPPPRASRVPGALVTSGGALVLAGGVAMLVDSFVRDASITAECEGPGRTHCPVSMKSQILSAVSTVDVIRGTGIAVGVVGVAGVSVGAWLLTRAAPPPTTGYVRLAPTLGPGSAGATFFGSF